MTSGSEASFLQPGVHAAPCLVKLEPQQHVGEVLNGFDRQHKAALQARGERARV